MKFYPSSFPAAAKATGFQPDSLEKVLRLRELLTEFHKHSFLRGKLVLKGGTALNLFYLSLMRLSVDIDLNYIAHVNREEMLADRPDIVKAVDQIATGLGYKLQNGADDHALREWHLGYANHAGAQDRIQVEINFLMRACALPRRSLSRRFGEQDWVAYRNTSGTHDSRTDPLRTELDGIGGRRTKQIPREDCFGLEKTGRALCHTTGRNRFVFIAAARRPSTRSRQSHGRKTEAA